MDALSGLLGHNIGYSISPSIHNEYYKKNHIKLTYKLFDIPETELQNFIIQLNKNNIKGFNVTIPYKEKILTYLTKLEYPAKEIGAVNTVLVKCGEIIGYNTDYFGFVQSLKENSMDINNSTVLIIGSGGSAKAIYLALKNLGAKNIHMLARNKVKARFDFKHIDHILEYGDSLDLTTYDLIVNCTPLGGANFINLSPIKLSKLKENAVVYDLNYNPKKTKLLLDAEILGAKIINGEQMLKNQAYSAINIWKQNLEI